MNCTICHKPLSGGVDTFGDVDFPMCEDDHLALIAESSYVPEFICTLEGDRIVTRRNPAHPDYGPYVTEISDLHPEREA